MRRAGSSEDGMALVTSDPEVDLFRRDTIIGPHPPA